jgi:hypothetical protein
MRYKRTDRKEFVKQLTRIERRQARVRRIRPQPYERLPSDEECPTTPEAHHTIGATENFSEHLGLFIQKYAGDPAIEVRSLAFLLYQKVLNLFVELRPEIEAAPSS